VRRIHRNTARVLPVDRDGRVLLFLGRELLRRGDHFWFTIGGAASRGETLAEAGARELREEVGITLNPARLGTPIGTSTIEFSWYWLRVTQDQTYFAFPADGDTEVSPAHASLIERLTIVRHAWLTAEDIEGAAERLGDAKLPAMIAAAVAAVGRRTQE
jgi:8-oxo-dGTP pyrophosphatase MutT (NUDIX family)